MKEKKVKERRCLAVARFSERRAMKFHVQAILNAVDQGTFGCANDRAESVWNNRTRLFDATAQQLPPSNLLITWPQMIARSKLVNQCDRSHWSCSAYFIGMECCLRLRRMKRPHHIWNWMRPSRWNGRKKNHRKGELSCHFHIQQNLQKYLIRMWCDVMW